MKSEDLVKQAGSRRFSRRRFLGLAAMAGIGAAGVALVGCGDNDEEEKEAATPASPPPPQPAAEAPAEEPAAQPTPLAVKLLDFKIELSAGMVAAGDVAITATNEGVAPHEVVILRTDLPIDGIPLAGDGTTANEETEGVTLVDRISQFEPGMSQSKTIRLERGRYLVICNIPGHYQLGMRAELVVS